MEERTLTIYTWLWLAWGLVFLLIEGRALTNKQADDTLSEHVWKWFTVRGKNARWTFQRFFLAAFMVWLSGHFIFGWWAG